MVGISVRPRPPYWPVAPAPVPEPVLRAQCRLWLGRSTLTLRFFGATTIVAEPERRHGGSRLNWRGCWCWAWKATNGPAVTVAVGGITETDVQHVRHVRAGRLRPAAFGTAPAEAYGTWRNDLTVPGVGSANYSVSRSAWAAGVGVEGAFAWNWTAKLEYLYLDTGSINDSTSIPGLTFTNRVRDNVVRVGINYLFNGGPVVARN